MSSHHPDSVSRREVDELQFHSLVMASLRYRWLGDPNVVSDCIADLFGRREIEREQLVSDIVVAYRAGQLPSAWELRRIVRDHASIKLLFESQETLTVPASVIDSVNSPHDCEWAVPELANESALAAWLSLPSARTLDWLTLPHYRRRTCVSHYRRIAIRKRDGSTRWIEEPRPVLKRVQRRLATYLLPEIPLHAAAHGFRLGHNIASCARPHVGQKVVVRIDLADFFGSIRMSRVASLFRVAGYSESVSQVIARLCTAPADADLDADDSLRHSRLPQGAPTSPGLANAIAFRLDRRLSGLSTSLGITYTRYADDLIFSGDELFAAHSDRFVTSAAAIAIEEGFRVNFRKTCIMRRGGRQRVLGLSVNDRLSTPRQEYEQLKAILHNCARGGPESQNREKSACFRESLRGRIAQISSVHPQRGEKLLQSFDKIQWPRQVASHGPLGDNERTQSTDDEEC